MCVPILCCSAVVGCDPFMIVEGRVLDSTGVAVEGARVELIVNADEGERSVASWISQANGTFDLRAIEGGKYRLRVSKNGYVTYEEMRNFDGGVNKDVTVVLVKSEEMK